MVRVLIDLRRSIVAHQLARSRPGATVLALVLATGAAAGTFVAGFASWHDQSQAASTIALLLALWVAGRLAQSALSGEPFLHPEIFTLLPLSRRRLAWSLLLVGLLDPVNLFLGVAAAAMVADGARLGLQPAVTAVVAVVLIVAATSALSTAMAGLLGPGARRGRDLGTVIVAVAISIVATAGAVLPALLNALRDGSPHWLAVLVRVLPTGWGPAAVAAAAHSHDAAALWLLGLLALSAGASLVWPTVLDRRMRRARAATHHARRRTSWRPNPALPSGPVAAVASKEVRLWLRDPVRLTCLLIAVVVGTGVGVIPLATTGTRLLLPFSGAMTTVIAAACACNLYGNDGAAMWPTVVTPDASRADVRGRQLGWILLTAPYAIASTAALTAASGQSHEWPWAITLVIALLGGGAGTLALGSVLAVQPLDTAGNPTPAWSLKIHIALLAVAATALPTLAALFAGWAWLAAPLAAATAGLSYTGLGRVAHTRLAREQVEILRLASS